MDKATNNNQTKEIISLETNEMGLSIHEIKTIYNKLNHNLIEVMERFEEILLRYWFDENDKKYINRRDCKFKTFTLREEDLKEHGTELISNIIEATLVDALHKSFEFFDCSDNDGWYEKLQDYKTEILKLEGDSTFLLKVINELYDSLNKVYTSFQSDYLFEITEVYEDDISLDFDFTFVYNQLKEKSDLIEKNNFLHDAIAEKDMLCLLLEVDPNNYIPNLQFKEKCKHAIEILKYQIENTLENSNSDKDQNKQSIVGNENSISESEIQIKNSEFSTRRQVLAMYYLLNEIDKNTTAIDRTVKARFIHFLTGKNESNIYKTLTEPLKGLENEKNKKSALKDMEYIKQHFDNLGLKSISQKISNDMAES